ncbi:MULTISPECIES: family 1 glycosylhydrolase [unclassified Novosphingobium]|uniref:family 1 glycosylhydrolase n=1 Tax=unclassified Novosphingobium TaxID=2644732 RepID=UPI000D31C533|nr:MULTISPECIES: family 1 glycosylhydrolase [unclassified Novosphingobium]PTR11403.1 aryl-beta-glucosidase [Novosphingobium sp. GV055]PUB04184.1 aryl-beta-glucosidase [Novosphingobium sp. GV061]PUB20575.1 aryl-beta-glucosidase [Novosphingobium sp. GV079]PUB42301.1 aryl-beta-glucosidase [Novosphingobium sp. GV027]
MLDRRTMLAAGAALAASATPALAKAAKAAVSSQFPQGFLWGASTAPHQIEGNNTSSDLWFLENQQPTVFAAPSGDAANSFLLWEQDLDLAKAIGLNTYRFGIEWARIEPEKGLFSQAMLDHYARVIDGCRARGLAPVVTFSHFTAPRWFSAQGGWANPESAALFARFADKATRHFGDRIHAAITFNEPNILLLLQNANVPPELWAIQKLTLETAAKRLGVPRFLCANVAGLADLPDLQAGLLAAHKAGKAAIKAAAPRLPVGLSLAMMDDQAVGKDSGGKGSLRDAKRQEMYGTWLDVAKADDFLGVQNYERALWGPQGRLPEPADAVRNWSGSEVWAPSLAGAVRYAHQATGVPILVSEHGVGTDDDTIRAAFIPAALTHLKAAIDDGVPVLGYCHWSLIDNFEWVFGYKPRFGLASYDPVTFARTAKPSAAVLGAIARANRV